ncbi:MAG: DUF1804 family protein [Pseudomonadota bacterium]
MAHGEEIRRAVRAGYVFDQFTLEAAALKVGVPEATAKRWKREAREAGDDWDRARSAQMIAGGGIEDVVRQTLAVIVQQTQATVDAIQAAEDMPAADKVQMLTSLADAYNKLMSASKKLMPETDAMAIRLDTVKRLGDFIRTRHPRHAAAFSEILEPFAASLAE